MRKIKFNAHLSIGYQSSHSDDLILEIDDEATDQDIDEAKEELLQEWAANFIDLSAGPNLSDEII